MKTWMNTIFFFLTQIFSKLTFPISTLFARIIHELLWRYHSQFFTVFHFKMPASECTFTCNKSQQEVPFKIFAACEIVKEHSISCLMKILNIEHQFLKMRKRYLDVYFCINFFVFYKLVCLVSLNKPGRHKLLVCCVASHII